MNNAQTNSLIGKYTKVLDKGFVGLIGSYCTDEMVETSARISYSGNNKKKDTGRLLNYLMRKSHASPFEMIEATFHVKLPLFCANQIVRHRTLNINFLSFRYCEPKEEVYTPDWRAQSLKNKQGSENTIENPALNTIYTTSTDFSFESYNGLIKEGVARELARSVIPMSTYTECYMKCDLRNWFNFLRLRSDDHAQYETQVYSDVIGSFLKELFPISFQAFLKHQFNSRSFTNEELSFMIDNGDRLGALNLDILKRDNESLNVWSTDSEIEDFLKKLYFVPKERFNLNKYTLTTLKEVDS